MLNICGLFYAKLYGQGSLIALLLKGYLEKPEFMRG
jgi:hypothetical protein